MRIIPDTEAIRYILQQQRRYICYLGAGASSEAGVMTAQKICDDIRGKLQPPRLSDKRADQWARERLNWDIPSRRYSTCMRAYGNPAKRVQYFREILREHKQPAFCHFALALLMTEGVFKKTCLTTNFDKLLESAFTLRRAAECQPIRNEDELNYWEDDQERCYVLKLHGDYDTNNILNTDDEVISISEKFKAKVRSLSEDAGMLVLGTAGYEKSIHTMFDYLTKEGGEKVLSYGLLWGVYIPEPEPRNITQNELEERIRQRIRGGDVGPDIVAMMDRMSLKNEDFCFFPLWEGTKNFMLDLIEGTGNKRLKATARLFLDQDMRLRNVFKRVQMKDAAITKHISSLKAQQTNLIKTLGRPSPTVETVFEARSRDRHGRVLVSVAYGDVTKRSWMAHEEFERVTRAVVSPEDTCISAGGGVAYLLLEKAGKYAILNELSKFSSLSEDGQSPVERGQVVVTSGGDLPVHYIFHAAAVEVTKTAKYVVSKQDVCKTMADVLEKARALGVGAVWVPLLGAGVASLGAKQSLEGILEAIAAWKPEGHKVRINIAIYKEGALPRHLVRQCLQRKLSARFSIQQPPAD